MNILFLTSRFPNPPLGGDRLRAFNFLKVLAKRHRVTLLALSDLPVPAKDVKQLKRYVAHCDVVVLPKRRSYINCVRGLFSPHPLQVHYYRSHEARHRLEHLLHREKFDLVFAHLIRMAEYALQTNGAPKILDLTDALSLTYDRSCSANGKALSLYNLAQRVERHRIRKYEAEMVERFDSNLLISPVDRTYLANHTSVERVFIVGAGVDLKYFSFYAGDYDADQLTFVGKMSTAPNHDAVLYFVKEILPLVERQIPCVKLSIVGIEPPADLLALHRPGKIEVTGHVPDVRPYLRKAAVSLCPMRIGAGAKNKVLESMAMGTPVVSTPIGIEGLEVQIGKHLLIGDSPETLANNVVLLMKDAKLRRRMANDARRLMEQRYSWDYVMEDLERVIATLVQPTQPTELQPAR